MRQLLIAICVLCFGFSSQAQNATCTDQNCDTIDVMAANFFVGQDQFSFDVLIRAVDNPTRIAGVAFRWRSDSDMSGVNIAQSRVMQCMKSDIGSQLLVDNDCASYGFFSFSGSDYLPLTNQWYRAGRVTIQHDGNEDPANWAFNKRGEVDANGNAIFPVSVATAYADSRNQPEMFVRNYEWCIDCKNKLYTRLDCGPVYAYTNAKFDQVVNHDAASAVAEVSQNEVSFSQFNYEGLMQIYAANGQLIYEHSVDRDSHIQLSTLDWADGIYFTNLISASGERSSFQWSK